MIRIVGAGFRSLMNETVGSLAEFPVWWHTRGFLRFVHAYLAFISDASRLLGVGVWARNLFVPMFGLHDYLSRAISILMRLTQIVFRGMAMILVALAGFIAAAIWCSLPAIAAVLLFLQLIGLF